MAPTKKKIEIFHLWNLITSGWHVRYRSRSKATVDSGDWYRHPWLPITYPSNFKPPTSTDTSPSGGSTPTVSELRVAITHCVGLAIILLCTYEDCFDVSNSFTFLMGQILCFSLVETLQSLKFRLLPLIYNFLALVVKLGMRSMEPKLY